MPAWLPLVLFTAQVLTPGLVAQSPAGTRTPSAAAAQASAADEDYRVYSDPPRLLLNAQRLRLLKRERERQTVRWQQFNALFVSGETLPEPGLAWALYYRVAGDPAAGHKAVEWALSDTPGSPDYRQLAFVFDWCGPVMSPAQADQLAAKLQSFLAAAPSSVSSTTSSSTASSSDASGADIRTQSARALAAIALADRLPDHGEAILRSLVQQWWRGNVVRRIETGEGAIPREELYRVYELMNVVRDNLKIDLRESASDYFQILPTDHLVSHYPVALQAQGDEYRVPAYTHNGDPDVTDAVFSRAAEMAMVALDTNAPEVQYVQGWLMQDRFIMRAPLGAPYEFLWANPYQPGLSYTRVPLVFHNPATGHVFARTTWDDDAEWIGFFDGHLQLFRDGQIQALKPGSVNAPLDIGDAMVVMASTKDSAKFHTHAETVVVLSLDPRSTYEIETDDQEMMEAETDIGGTLVLRLPKNTDAGVRLRKRSRE